MSRVAIPTNLLSVLASFTLLFALLKATAATGAAREPETSPTASAVPAKRNLWSIAPLSRPPLPRVGAGASALRTSIDAFIVAKIEEQGLKLAPEADRRTLLRRLYFDLVGLPPAYSDVEAFVLDESEQAYERLVDRLLHSPQYGERWARHWLDVVHYGESHGYDKDKPRLNAWPYRDYVIRAFNDDRPHGRFIEEQVAGDVLFPWTRDGVEALGFISAGPWDFIGHAEVPETKTDGKIARHLDRDDMATNTIQTFNSLTVQCAQCHDHKFDPISQEDYYSLQAVFAALDRTDRSYDLDPDVARRRAALTREIADLTVRRQSLGEGFSPKASSGLEDLNREIVSLQAALSSLPAQKMVYAATVRLGTGSFAGTGAQGGKPRTLYTLARGDVLKPLKEVGPGALEALTALPARFELPAHHPEGERRAALAKWISDPRNPLTWRSIVNRVWQYHFGRGLVETSNDLGHMGSRPTHPELLDWLAVEFRDGGQSLKKLHKLIVMSATYRQASMAEPNPLDSDNRYLSRMNRRKLEAEAVRDSMLMVAGKLRLDMGGPSFQDFVMENPEHSPHYRYDLHDAEDPNSHRRSVYRFIVRSQQQPFFTTLDCADPSLQVARRNESVSPLQSLALLNNSLVLVMAKHFASRIESGGGDLEARVMRAHADALGRLPTARELEAFSSHAREFGFVSLCRVLFNLNEFSFVD